MPKTAASPPVNPSELFPGPDQGTEHANIHAALLAIYREGNLYIQKASRNTQQSYNYVSEADFLEKMRPRLAAHGIVCTPEYEVVSEWDMTTAKGSVMRGITLRGTFTYTHVPSGTFVQVRTIGQGTDQQDKAAYKAMTGAQKYAIRQPHLMETGDDPEQDRPDESGPATRTPAPPADPRSRFEIDLEVEIKRLGTDIYLSALKKWKAATPECVLPDGGDLLTLPSDQKRSLMTWLRATPPF